MDVWLLLVRQLQVGEAEVSHLAYLHSESQLAARAQAQVGGPSKTQAVYLGASDSGALPPERRHDMMMRSWDAHEHFFLKEAQRMRLRLSPWQKYHEALNLNHLYIL